MESVSEEFDAASNPENWQSIIGRMAKAKWITGWNGVGLGRARFCWTELGKARMQKINAVSKNSSLKNLQSGSAEIESVLDDLRPPPFSPGEQYTMIELILQYTRQEASKVISPPRF